MNPTTANPSATDGNNPSNLGSITSPSTSYAPSATYTPFVPSTASPPIDLNELRKELTRQLEYVFTKDFILSSPYLMSNINDEHYIPCNAICNLDIVKVISTDKTLITDILRNSDKIIFNEEKEMAKSKTNLVERHTIIIRDIPEGTTEEEVKAIFEGDSQLIGSIVELKKELAVNFFIKFPNEEITMHALNYVRGQTFKGNPIHARIKTENLHKSIFYGSSDQDQTSYISYDSYPNEQYYYSYADHEYHGSSDNNRRRGGFKKNKYRGGRGRGPVGNPGNAFGSPKKSNQPKENRKPPVLSSPTLWPPLPTAQKSKSAYQHEFIKYPKETIISIISNIKEDVKPSIPDCPVVTNEYLNELACHSTIPPNTKMEWIEPQARSRKNSANVTRPHRSSNSKNQDHKNNNEDHSNKSQNQKEQHSQANIPTGAWQTGSSSVKTPPTQQQKNLLKPKQQTKKRKGPKPAAKYQKKPETQSNTTTPSTNNEASNPPGSDTGSSGAQAGGGGTGSASLSYADIARSTPSPVEQ